MLNRSMSRLATAVAVAGTVCALGAASAAAATPGWSGRTGPVPHAFSNATPAMTSVTFPGHAAVNTLVAWKGQRGAHVFYEYTASPTLSGGWSKLAFIPGARSGAGPSVASYIDPLGREAVLAVWKGLGNGKIFYAQGETHGDGTISWTAPVNLPHTRANSTDKAPAVLFPANAARDRVIISWRGPFHHVRIAIGNPVGRHFRFFPSHPVAPTPITQTGAAPALAEVQTGTAKGRLYVFWRGRHSTEIRYATASDPLKVGSTGALDWSAPAVVPGAQTGTNPAASALSHHGFGPLMLTYKAPASLQVRFQLLAGGVWSAPANVPGALTGFGPAQLRGVLATTSADSSGNIFFHIFS
jgi:hypothetical protein